jgi:hypothetical protein
MFASQPMKTNSTVAVAGDTPTGWKVVYDGNANAGAGHSTDKITAYVIGAS